MNDKDDAQKHVILTERLAGGAEPGRLPPIAPDGGFIPPVSGFSQSTALKATPEDFVCLRGPCRFYVEITSQAEVEFVSEVEGYVPTQTSRLCRVIPGIEIDLGEENVLSCNRWDPNDLTKEAERLARCEAYLRFRPQCDEADDARQKAREEHYVALNGNSEGDE